eukprot:1147809-Pelagomonas_calceolata.AAC.4
MVDARAPPAAVTLLHTLICKPPGTRVQDPGTHPDEHPPAVGAHTLAAQEAFTAAPLYPSMQHFSIKARFSTVSAMPAAPQLVSIAHVLAVASHTPPPADLHLQLFFAHCVDHSPK